MASTSRWITHQRDATALWAAFAHAHDLCDYAPPLIIKSPAKRCGKTRLQETLALLVPRPQPTSGINSAAFSRIIEKHHPTMLIDEYDAQAAGDKEMAESLRGQLNSSFNRRSAVVLKSVPLPGGGWDTRQFSTWAPTCVAGIGKQSETVEDRGVIIRLERKRPDVKVKRLRGKDGGDLVLLARKLARFVADNETALRNAEPKAPDALNDRQQDAWTPLCAIADLAGGEWPERARAAAKALCQVAAEEDVEADIKTVLLADIRDIFARLHPTDHAAHEAGRVGRPDDGPRILTKQLLDELIGLEERPWSAWGKARKATDGHRPCCAAAALWDTVRHRSGRRKRQGQRLLSAVLRGRLFPLPAYSRGFNPRSRAKSGKHWGKRGFCPVPNSIWHGAENAGNANNSGVWHGCDGSEGGKWGPRGKPRARMTPKETPRPSGISIYDGHERARAGALLRRQVSPKA